MVNFLLLRVAYFSGRPPEGTFHLGKILAAKIKTLQTPGGHPDQVTYILTWEDLVRHPPPWLCPFILPTGTSPTAICAVKEKKILATPDMDLLFDLPPPYPPASPPTNPPAGLHQGATSPLAPPDSESQSAASSPLAPLQSPPDSESESGPRAGTWSHGAAQPGSTALPLRAYDDEGNQPLQYWPFSSADLYNWKAHNPPFLKIPKL